MPKDRLKDLQKSTSRPRVTYTRLSRQYRSDELQFVVNDGNVQFTSIPVDNDHSVAEFLVQMDLIQKLIDKVQELAKEVEHIHSKMLAPMANPKLGQELDDKTADIKKLAYDIATKLKKMEQAQENQDDNDKASARWRIKESQIFNITRRFREVMNQYNQESVLHRDRCKKAISRELEISGNRRSDDELEEMIQSGFPKSISLMADIEKAKQAVDAIEARQRDIVKLENSIKELHDMFIDLAMLVTAQGEMIDIIEHNVLKTKDFVEQGAVQLYKAKESQEGSNRRKCYICIIVIAVVVVLALLIGAYFLIQNKLIG